MRHAARITVFTETARQMVLRTGVAAGHQVVVVPHGAPVALQSPPAADAVRPEFAELLASLGRQADPHHVRPASAGKGIDHAIDALAEVVERHPDTQYVVAGATHPEIVRHDGETYRQSLHDQVERLGPRRPTCTSSTRS